MIRYRPHRSTISASLKDEQIFDSVEEMLSYVFDAWSRVVLFLGAEIPPSQDEILIGEDGCHNPLVGYVDEHKVFVPRLTDKLHRVPLCIGYIDMEAIL